MGDSGACCNASRMSDDDKKRWILSNNGIELRPGLTGSKTCMSWSTEGTCEFIQGELLGIQANFESKGCNGIWAAPLWMTPKTWTAPQHKTGEIDFFERGCVPGSGYITSFGEGDPYIVRNSWGEETNPQQDSSFTAYITFDRSNDVVNMYKCPLGSKPIDRGPDTEACMLAISYPGYFDATKDQTKNHTELMHLVSDVWNDPKCTQLPCGHGQTSDDKCTFKVSDIKMGFTDDYKSRGARSPFQNLNGSEVCGNIWHPVHPV